MKFKVRINGAVVWCDHVSDVFELTKARDTPASIFTGLPSLYRDASPCDTPDDVKADLERVQTELDKAIAQRDDAVRDLADWSKAHPKVAAQKMAGKRATRATEIAAELAHFYSETDHGIVAAAEREAAAERLKRRSKARKRSTRKTARHK